MTTGFAVDQRVAMQPNQLRQRIAPLNKCLSAKAYITYALHRQGNKSLLLLGRQGDRSQSNSMNDQLSFFSDHVKLKERLVSTSIPAVRTSCVCPNGSLDIRACLDWFVVGGQGQEAADISRLHNK